MSAQLKAKDRSVKGWMTVKEAAVKLVLSEFHTKELVRKGLLTARKVLVPGTKIPRWEIDPVSVDNYSPKHTTRADGRRKIVGYVDPNNVEEMALAKKIEGFKWANVKKEEVTK
jgi:hypothetical protein